MEKRFDPLWHVVGYKRAVFDRGREYRVPPADSTVQSVTVLEHDYPVVDGSPRHFIIHRVEHCKDEVARWQV